MAAWSQKHRSKVKTTLFALTAMATVSACQTTAQAPAQLEPASQQASVTQSNPLVVEAQGKIAELESLMEEARASDIDVAREETTLWFAREFLKFADWDEANRDQVAFMFEQYAPYRDQAAEMADMLPDFERQEVVNILDASLAELGKVVRGEITRRPTQKIDWGNIEVADDMLRNNGRPVFLYDYFSKTVGQPLTNGEVYNDHLGAIFHGGENLYPVNHDRAINPYLLREDWTYDPELLAEVTEIDDSNVGFLIYWNMGIPDWVKEQEPQAEMGRSLFTGFDIDNPLVRRVWGKIASDTGEMTKDKKVSQLGYILSNEPHWFSEAGHWSQRFREMNEISTYTQDKFRDWLARKYEGDIAGLNANWDSAFADFASVEIAMPIDPALRGQPIWYDWSRYNMDRAIDWFTFLQGELRKGNPDADTSIKIMPNMWSENPRSHGIDTEALTNLTSMIGNDAKTSENRLLNYSTPMPWEEHYSWFWEELSYAYDFFESVSPGKIHFNSESHFLSASWSRKLDMSTDYVRSVYWLATLQGMDVNLGWFWARDPDGSPEDRLEGDLNFFDPALAGSYAGSVNQQPQVANETTQVMMDLNAFSEEIFELRAQKRPLRLFYSETSAINKTTHMTQLFKMYEEVFFEGFPMGFATQNVLETHDHDEWEAVLVYRTPYVTDAEFAALQAYLDAGGTVITDGAQSLGMNEYGQARGAVLEQSAGKLIMVDGTASPAELADKAMPEIADAMPPVAMSQDNGTAHPGVTWRAVERADGSILLNAVNLGKTPARLSISKRDGSAASATDMFTGLPLGSEFEIGVKKVLLIEID